jgi:large subunit ribosomal protein L44e
MIDYSALF